MQGIEANIKDIQSRMQNALQKASSLKEVERIRVEFLGKSGLITGLFPLLKNLSLEEKKEFGPIVNRLKSQTEEAIQNKIQEITTSKAKLQGKKLENFDVTSYKIDSKQGHLHPYTHMVEEVEDIFISMGYEVLDGPEVEQDFYNFTALNIPQDHPARDMYDTFWLNLPNMLLRTHTSPVQIRAMQQKKLPIAAIVPGRCYRHEATDASHDFMFMQTEGFLIGKNVTLSHLFGTAKSFLKAIFKKEDINIRIRPGFFPFVEPGVEIDVECPFCKRGCSVCKKTTWIELFPGGLIHPNVLRAGNIDPKKYSGFAFGFGLTRLAMIKYGINDIRLFHGGKVRFLEQF